MCRRFTVVGLPAACLLLLAVAAACCGNAPAAEDILRLVPDSALGLVVVNRPAAADAKLQALGHRCSFPCRARGLCSSCTPACRRAGTRAGPWPCWSCLPRAPAARPAILLAPVTDYRKFVAQLSAEDAAQPVTKVKLSHAPFWVRNIAGYAALADESHREALEKTLTLAPAVPAAL